jgi:multiple sugar transport system permease protein
MTTFGILPRWWITAAALTISAILLSPFYWVLVGSFMTPAELFGGHMSFWPQHFAFENWSRALSRLWPHIQNSLLVSAVASVGTIVITAPAAYGLVWRKPLGRQALLAFMLMTQMLPAIVFVIPLFIVFTQINLVNTLSGLILADMTFTIPFALIMLSAYMKDLPYELVEAALVDGAGQLRAFLMIVLPMTLPGLITVGVFSFLIPWGDLIFALSLITDANLQPLTLELYKSVGQYGVDWGFLLPGSILTAIPAVVFVIAASRFIVAGVTRGAIK